MLSTCLTTLNYFNKFKMTNQNYSSGHLALETRKSKSQLLKSHISLKMLFEWTNMFEMHLKFFKPFIKDLYHKFKLFKWFFVSIYAQKQDLTL